jgi:hypothetical protein
MKSYISVCALALVVGACSGSNPFTVVDASTGGTSTTPTTTPTVTAIQGGMTSFAYDEANNTLSVSGIAFSEDGTTATYRRRSGLDIMAADGSIGIPRKTNRLMNIQPHT